MSIYRIIELSIWKLEFYPNIIEFIWSIHMITNGKIGQNPAKFDNVIDNISKYSQVYVRGVGIGGRGQ